MKRIIGFVTGILLVAVIPLFAGFEDVATDDASTKTVKTQKKATIPPTDTTSKPQSNVAPPPPPPPPPPQVDVKSLKFSKEISGFGYKSSDATLSAVENNMKTVIAAVMPLIKKIPDTYKIQVIGYADATGPENPEGDKPGNLSISRDRAEAVVDYIVKNYSLSSDRFEITGKGSANLKNPSSPASPVNRRVIIKFEP